MAEWTLEQPSGFEQGTPGLDIQQRNYQAITMNLAQGDEHACNVHTKTFLHAQNYMHAN